MQRDQELQAYWKRNLSYIAILLAIWFSVSYLCGIVLADFLDNFWLAGFPLGFWFANQGAELTFCLLILIYVRLMNRLDHKYNVFED
jgi:putative solute:sodium symporter small subunit